MNLKHPMGVLHSFSIKNVFYGKMDLRLFYFHVTIKKIEVFDVTLSGYSHLKSGSKYFSKL